MKLRMRGDSVRLRLTRTEVKGLVDSGTVEEVTRFPGGTALRYRLAARAGIEAIGASFADGTLTVFLPAATARHWAESDEVGIRAALPFAERELSVLIEKDFPCLTGRPGEDDSDSFPTAEAPVKC